MKKGLLKLLNYARNEGIQTVVALSSDKSTMKWYMLLINTRSLFTHIIGVDVVGGSKSNPGIFKSYVESVRFYLVKRSHRGFKEWNYNSRKAICISDMVTHSEEIDALTYKILSNLSEVFLEVK